MKANKNVPKNDGADISGFRDTIVEMMKEELIELIDKKAEEFLALDEDWDGYGAPKMKQDIIDMTRSFLINLSNQVDIKNLPSICACGDGGVDIDWNFNQYPTLLVCLLASPQKRVSACIEVKYGQYITNDEAYDREYKEQEVINFCIQYFLM